MKEEFLGDDPKSKINLAMSILENAAIRDGGKLLFQSTYILEGDDPLVLTASNVLKN